MLAGYGPRDFAVQLWNGSTLPADAGQPERFAILLRDPSSLRTAFLPPKCITFLEAYFFGAYEIEGDLIAYWKLVQYLYEGGLLKRRAIEEQLAALPEPKTLLDGRRAVTLDGEIHGLRRDQAAITSHFDVSNDFYALWLDQRMVYTCAYFKAADNDLDTAQRDKLDLVCRKLRLRRGERMLDVGCGWGGLAIYAAEHYGVDVTAVTLSRAQADWAQARIKEKGIGAHCRVQHSDYRDVRTDKPFDKISSIGMTEHLGEAKLPSYFQHIWKLLKPGGVFMNHAIGTHPAVPVPVGSTFIHKYVFPDGELSPISTLLAAAEHAGFEVRDVECLREHYEKTCTFWLHRLEAQAARASELTDPVTYRMWRMYLAYSAFGFAGGLPTIYQSLLSKADHGRSGFPLVRSDWYQDA